MRRERPFRAGTRVRIVAPGCGFNGRLGTVQRDTPPHGALIVDMDRGGVGAFGTAEAARLRDQGQPR